MHLQSPTAQYPYILQGSVQAMFSRRSDLSQRKNGEKFEEIVPYIRFFPRVSNFRFIHMQTKIAKIKNTDNLIQEFSII